MTFNGTKQLQGFCLEKSSSQGARDSNYSFQGPRRIKDTQSPLISAVAATSKEGLTCSSNSHFTHEKQSTCSHPCFILATSIMVPEQAGLWDLKTGNKVRVSDRGKQGHTLLSAPWPSFWPNMLRNPRNCIHIQPWDTLLFITIWAPGVPVLFSKRNVEAENMQLKITDTTVK